MMIELYYADSEIEHSQFLETINVEKEPLWFVFQPDVQFTAIEDLVYILEENKGLKHHYSGRVVIEFYNWNGYKNDPSIDLFLMFLHDYQEQFNFTFLVNPNSYKIIEKITEYIQIRYIYISKSDMDEIESGDQIFFSKLKKNCRYLTDSQVQELIKELIDLGINLEKENIRDTIVNDIEYNHYPVDCYVSNAQNNVLRFLKK